MVSSIILLVPLLAAMAAAKPLTGTDFTSIASILTGEDPRTSDNTIEVITVAIPDGVNATTAGTRTRHSSFNSTTLRPLPSDCSGRDMPNDNFESINAAIAAMAKDCAGTQLDKPVYIMPRTGKIWRAEEAQVYWCNYSWDFKMPIICTKGMYDFAAKHIDEDCGAGGGGWLELNNRGDGWHTIGRDPRHDEHLMEISECGF